MREKNQVVLPLDLGIRIPEGDFVFKVAEICESLDYTELFNTYLRNWRKVNPITMFELLVFGYMERKFSSYAIEKACRTDIRFMWLLEGEPTPSIATIKRFQSEKLSEAIEGLFYQFVNKLCEMGEVKFKNLFVDGTKIEAYASKYTFVWKSAVEKNLAKLEKKISACLLILSRSIQVEGVFGVLKEDYGFRRFLTRRKKNIETQFFLLAFALTAKFHSKKAEPFA